MRKKEDLRIIKTKSSLYRGLVKLMEKMPFDDIKVSEICSESLINRSTFYDHFADKYELFQSLINTMRENLLENIKIENTPTNIKAYAMEVLRQILNHIEKNKDLFSAVLKTNGNSVARDMVLDLTIANMAKGIKEHFQYCSLEAIHNYILFYTSGVINVISDSLKDPNKYDKDKLYEFFYKVLPETDNLQYKKEV